MDMEELAEEVTHAEALMSAEATRSGALPCRDPAIRSGFMTDEDIKHLRSRHPFLADFSDAFIRNTPVGDLMKIETTSLKIREVERAKDACNKLAANKAALSSIFSNVEAGTDNRWNKLHPARFLAGAGCSATKL